MLSLLNFSIFGGNNFTSLPSCGHLYNLRDLEIEQCDQLQEILEIPEQLGWLRADGCESLGKIPSDVGHIDDIDLCSCHELVSNGSAIYDLFKLEHARPGNRFTSVALPGGEMPEWLLPNSDGHISFVASKDLLKKFLGLVFCVVFRAKDGKEEVSFQLTPSINSSEWMGSFYVYFSSDSDHVWLRSEKAGFLWQGDPFGPNEWSCFQFTIRTSASVIVKKCGFRLLYKPLEKDLEVFLQHNQLLDPALLYEVQHAESPTNTEKYRSLKLVLKESNMADFSIEKYRYSLINGHYRNVRPGGEMPEEFVPVEEDTICFMASQDLYDKFLGLALCVVFGVEDGKKEISFDIVPHVNSQRRNVLSGTLSSFDSDHVWIQYLKSNVLWGLLEGGVDFGEFDERYLRFSLRLKVSGGTIKKLGYVIRCRQLEDDLKVVLEDNQFVNLASLCEDSHEPEDSEIDSWFNWPVRQRQTEYLRRCHLHREELDETD